MLLLRSILITIKLVSYFFSIFNRIFLKRIHIINIFGRVARHPIKTYLFIYFCYFLMKFIKFFRSGYANIVII